MIDDISERYGAEHLVLQLAHRLAAGECPLQLFVRQTGIHHAPNRYLFEVADTAAVAVADLQVERYHAFLIVQYADGHPVRRSQQRTRHIAAHDAGTQGVLLHVFGHEGFARRFPVVLHRIGIHVGRAAHDGFGLRTQIAQHGRVWACELHLDGMRSRYRKVVLADADIGIGILFAELLPHNRNLLQNRMVILAVHDEFAVAVAARGYGAHQTVMGRGTALTDGHTVDGGILHKPVAHRQQPVAYYIGVRCRGKEALDDELFVVEIGEKEVLYLRHAEDAERQHTERRNDGRALAVD